MITMDPKALNTAYEDVRNRLNMFAKDNGLQDEINAYLVALIQNNQFNHLPHQLHLGLDVVSIISKSRFGDIVDVPVQMGHHGIDYYDDWDNFQTNKALQQQQQKISAKLLNTLSLLAAPKNYAEAYAMQKLLLNINPHFLDANHFQEFKNLRGKAELEMHRYGQQQVDNQLKQQQDQAMDKIQAVSGMQEALNEAIVGGHAEILDLLELLKAQGIEISEKLIKGLMQNQLIQKDVRTIIAYLENAEMEKIRQQKKEMKMASYQGLYDACYFTAELGNVVGSKDLVRAAQIAQAGIRIQQASDQILNASTFGVAILSPYAAIGLAVMKVFSLFQKNNSPHAMIMKQLANISRQIKALHQDVLRHFGRVDEKLNYLLEKILEGFEHLQLSLHVNIDMKLSQIQSEIATLTKITKIGFEALLTQDLSEQLQYVDDVKQGVIVNPSLTQAEYETRMGKLVRFISENANSPILNGLVYKHLLENTKGSTQQVIEILSQRPVSILHGLLGLLVEFAKVNLAVPELKTLFSKNIVHPGLWQLALQAYSDMHSIYRGKYNYDPRGVRLKQFRQQGQDLSLAINVFSSNIAFYQRIFDQLNGCRESINTSLQAAMVPVISQPSSFHLFFEVPEKLKNTKEIKKVNQEFFLRENLIQLLKKNKKAIPEIFFSAEGLALGYFEFKVHLPDSVRSRKHHHGEFGISQGGRTGLEINFIMGNQIIHITEPQLSENYNSTNLKQFYSYILTRNTKLTCKPAEIEQMKRAINQHGTVVKQKIALDMANRLQDNPSYHQLLKLNHFLIAYLIYGGFSEEAITEIKGFLLMDNIADQFAAIAQSPQQNIDLPVLKIASEIELAKIKQLIENEINENVQTKVSVLSAHLHSSLVVLDELDIARTSLVDDSIKIAHKPGQTYGELFSANPSAVPKNTSPDFTTKAMVPK